MRKITLEDIRSIPVEALIRKVPTTNSFQTYVLADAIYSLLEDDEVATKEESGGRAIPPKDTMLFPLEKSVEGLMILAHVKLAVMLQLPGAKELNKLIKKGDVIFLKASGISSEADGADDVRLALWHERFHLVLERLDRKLSREILTAVDQTTCSIWAEACREIAEIYQLDPDKDHDAMVMESLTNLLTLALVDRRDKVVQDLLAGLPDGVVERLHGLIKESEPSSFDVIITKLVARRFRNQFQHLSYRDLIDVIMCKSLTKP